ncbi:34142_t:CDS:2, partial [Gigaspora margarita]
DNSLVDLNFQTVVEAYGYNSSHEDFSLKTFLEQEIIFLDLFSGPDHSPDIPEEPGYREWIVYSDLNLSPIEVEILDFFKEYSSDDSDDTMVIDLMRFHVNISMVKVVSLVYHVCRSGVVRIQEVSDSKEDNPVLPIM